MFKKYLKADITGGLVVSLVAIPLCLGIAVSSGMSPISGMIAGIIGGIIIGSLSKAQLSVSGPAAGLITIIATGVQDLGIHGVLLAIFIAGLFQIVLSIIRAGTIAYYFPSSVIEGMLAAIGITIIFKNIPVTFGFAPVNKGEATIEFFGRIFSDYQNNINMIALGTGVVSVIAMVLWDKIKPKALKPVPGAVIAVIIGFVSYFIFHGSGGNVFKTENLVQLPVLDSFSDFSSLIILPEFGLITNSNVWILALSIGMVASIETLLTIEATDKLDPMKRVTPTNRELFAQGIGNSISGLLGGLPITSVIVRSKANMDAGGRTKTATIVHGVILLLGTLFIAKYLNMIPLASLSAILIVTGFKLCDPKMFKHVFSLSKHQWIPFIVTIIAILSLDLLKGVGIGMLVGVYFILRGNMKSCYTFHHESKSGENFLVIQLSEELSFLKKAFIIKTLARIKRNSNVIIDAKNTVYIDFDVLEIIREFKRETAPQKNINLKLLNFKDEYNIPSDDAWVKFNDNKTLEIIK